MFFLVLVWVLVVLFFGFPVFLCFCFVHNSPKWLYSCIFRGFLFILFPQKACLKLFLFFLFFFLCFCLPFQKSIFSVLFVHQPLFRKDSLWVFICFSFPVLMFACLFETNFPDILFKNPSCSQYWQFIFSSVVLVFLFSWCMFEPFCFYVGFVVGIFCF